MFKFFFNCVHKFFSPKYFLVFSNQAIPFAGVFAFVFISVGIVSALWFTPNDFQQDQMYRIMYIHVPAAWLSLTAYVVLAGMSIVFYLWKIKIADYIAKNTAWLGAFFTILTLLTGSIWGKPAWGSFWSWDARIISEFILLMLYVSYLTLHYALPAHQSRSNICAILAILGLINLPIIKFSVDWWSSLHQSSSINLFTGNISMDWRMLSVLLVIWLGYLCYYFWAILNLTQRQLLHD